VEGVKHILVVDDDPSMVLLVRKILQAAGYRVSTAPSGMAALGAVRQETPDLVILDLSMSGIDGFEVCAMLKRTRDFKSPIAVLSGRTTEKDIEAALGAGADAFIPKPVDRAALLGKVAELLAKREAPVGS
jgi:two-component system, OmpR family, alkaline phosphatase synthesis response regulator PhoP